MGLLSLGLGRRRAGKLRPQLLQVAHAGEHAGALVHHGTSHAHLAGGPHDGTIRSGEAQGRVVPSVDGKRRLQGRAHHHITQKRLHGAPGLFREEELVHKGDALGPAKALAPNTGRAADAGGTGVVANEEGRLARGTGGGELSGDELYRARVFHEQRGHVPAQKRFHQRLEAGRGLDDVGERLAEPQHLVDVLHEPRPGLAGGKRA